MVLFRYANGVRRLRQRQVERILQGVKEPPISTASNRARPTRTYNRIANVIMLLVAVWKCHTSHLRKHTFIPRYEDAQVQDKNNRTPYVYPACGHVLAYARELDKPHQGPVGHDSLALLFCHLKTTIAATRSLLWLPASRFPLQPLIARRAHFCQCPLCRKKGPFEPLTLQWEPSICAEEPTVVFNPCGHMTSEAAAIKWSRIELPDNSPPNSRFRPICPFCARALRGTASTSTSNERPFNRIIFWCVW